MGYYNWQLTTSVILADLVDGKPEKLHIHAVPATDVGFRELQNCVGVGHEIRKAMADRDAYNKLAGLIERDDNYLGAPKPGKRGLGASGKAKKMGSRGNPGV
jgi:hypothetical protein